MTVIVADNTLGDWSSAFTSVLNKGTEIYVAKQQKKIAKITNQAPPNWQPAAAAPSVPVVNLTPEDYRAPRAAASAGNGGPNLALLIGGALVAGLLLLKFIK